MCISCIVLKALGLILKFIFVNIGLFLMTSVLPFHNAWGQKLAILRITGSRKFPFFAQKTLLFQHNKLAMAANVGDTNRETDKLELYP